MSYFDHVKCNGCGAQLAPESLVTMQGHARCPKCGGNISLADLFGIADRFSEEDAPNVTIDDLVPGGPSRGASSAPPRASERQEPGLVKHGGGSALDALRSMKKNRKS